MNFLHPIYHGHSYQVGSRMDLDRRLPRKLDEADLNELLDSFSEHPRYIERIAPVSAHIGEDVIRGKNWTELMIKGYRIFTGIFSNITTYVRQTMRDVFKEKGMVPFLSIAIEPDTLYRILEMDYETAENTYARIMELYREGVVAPCATVPFHVILPMLEDDYDVRLCTRIGLLFYWPILITYHNYLKTTHNGSRFVVPFWLPEGGYSKRMLEILYDQFMSKCNEEKIKDPHLVLMLDNHQAIERDTDVLMKSWNIIKLDSAKNAFVSVVFRDRHFSNWVTFSNPSVKKLLDRTIAKVDADLNIQNIDYCWSHFEDIEALTYTIKASKNFEQKIIKLTELGYLALAPDMFVRRKLSRNFRRTDYEPQSIMVKDNTTWTDWHVNNISLGRWQGTLDSNAEYKLVDENHAYTRFTKNGAVEEQGPQCWKIGFNKAVAACVRTVKGDSKTCASGMLGVLASLVPSKNARIKRRNVDNFLVHYAYIHWKEHFVHHGMSEADIYLPSLAKQYLFQGCKGKPSAKKTLIAGLAAQAYYFALDGYKSCGTFWENFDQRAVYQNVAMVTLAMVNAMYAYHWLGKPQEARKVLNVLKEEFIGFEHAYRRYKLAEYGVTEPEWKDAIKSTVDDSDLNVVARAARRIGARHLRLLGYRKDFSFEDENISTNTGHIWSGEISNTNFKWENRLFCGLLEE